MNDVRYALRQLRGNPIFGVVAVMTLGLGIGMNAAIFGVARTALAPSFPFEAPDRLVRIYQVPETGAPDLSPRSPAFMLVRDNVDAFERVAGFRFTDFTLATPEGPERIVGGVITPGWLATLGVRPALGRDFTAEEEAVGGASQVALVSHAIANRQFGSGEAALGETIRLNGTPHDIVGVLPEGFTYPYSALIWVPFRPEEGAGEGSWALNIQGRIASSHSLATAEQQLRALSERMAGITPGLSDGMTLIARPLGDTLVDDEGRTALALMAAVGLLLLVACANLANLLLGRALGRASEFALRSSLGASRGRLVRQALVESLVLGAAGCTAGIALAWLGSGLLQPLVPERLATLGAKSSLDPATLAFASGLSLLTAVALGVVPALRASGARPADAMRRGRGGAHSSRAPALGRALVIGELTVTLMLLTGVGLMVRDLRRLQTVDLAYDPEGLVMFSVAIDREPYDTPETRTAFTDRLVDELVGTPGISGAGMTTMFPRHRGNSLAEVAEEGRDPARPAVPINHRLVSPGFLETIGVPLLRGRSLLDSDGAGSLLVGLVSESLARTLWPGEDALGRRLTDRRDSGESGWVTVVGVVPDVLQADDVPHTWYLPYRQHAGQRMAGQATFVAAAADRGSPPSLGLIRGALGRVDRNVPPFEVVTATTLNYESLSRQRLGTRIGGLFGAFGLLLATLGVYGSISYSVQGRMREFGVRIALGSDRRGILTHVLGDVGRVLGIGLGLGLLGSLAVARLGNVVLTGVAGFDPVAFGASCMLLTATALTAGAIPAVRAARADPVKALRAE